MNTKSTRNLMKSLIMPALAGFSAFLAIGCASTTTAPTTQPVATARIQEWSAAYYGSATSGNGTLNFNGQRRNFSITGVGAGGAGGMKVAANAKIYNLNSIQDFPGTYSGVSNGLTLIEGTMHAKLTNDNGVVMYIAGETEGLASSVGVQKFKIDLTN
jgi:hypothetical protein